LGSLELLSELLGLLAQTSDFLLQLLDLMFDGSDLTGESLEFLPQVIVFPLKGADPRLGVLDLFLNSLELSLKFLRAWSVVATGSRVGKSLLELLNLLGQLLNGLPSLAAGTNLATFDTGLWYHTDWLAWTGTWSLDWGWSLGSAWWWAWSWSWLAASSAAVGV